MSAISISSSAKTNAETGCREQGAACDVLDRWSGRLARFALACLWAAMAVGLAGALFYTPLYRVFGGWRVPFQSLRPLHMASATAWVYLAGISIVLHQFARSQRDAPPGRSLLWAIRCFAACWMLGAVVVVVTLALQRYSGRKYFFVSIPSSALFWIGWVVLTWTYLRHRRRPLASQPVYVWMWTTSLGLFTYAFLETHAFLLPYFQRHPLREIAVEWKSYGTLVGSFNLLVYGSLMFLYEQLDARSYARSPLAFGLFIVGVVNSFTNYGHHTYHVPQWWLIKWISFAISMTEIIILAKVAKDLLGWSKRLRKDERWDGLTWLLFATTGWTFIHLFVALKISVPKINSLFHGTLVVASHAMGSMIGIDTMGLLAVLAWISVTSRGEAHPIPRWPVLCLNIGLLIVWGLFLFRGVQDGLRRWEYGILPSLSVWPGWFGWSFSAGGFLMLIGAVGLTWPWMFRVKRRVARQRDSREAGYAPEPAAELAHRGDVRGSRPSARKSALHDTRPNECEASVPSHRRF